MQIKILPSLLAADFGHLADEICRAAASGADALHLDVMDAHFVPNLSFGPDVVALSRRVAPSFYRHVHLMMTRPDLYLEPFAKAGAQTIQIHVEADCDIHAVLARIRALGLRPALVLNPETPAAAVFPYLRETDEILVMTVHPGYGGQSFIADCLPKITAIRSFAGPALDIMVDGGINDATAARALAAGANQFVAGSHLFHAPDMSAAVAALRSTLSPETPKLPNSPTSKLPEPLPEYELAGIETIARGVCVQDGRVLLCRAKGGATTYLPGGHIEFGETARAALVREMQEEMGVTATAGEFLGVVENQFHQHGKPHAEINLVYRMELPPGTAAAAREDWIDFTWCPLADLASAHLLPAAMAHLVVK